MSYRRRNLRNQRVLPSKQPVRRTLFAAKRGSDVVRRFYRRIEKLPGRNACWCWTGGCYGTGYGAFKVSGENTRAHVFMYELKKGRVDRRCKKRIVRHSCDNRWCVRPSHLLLGTYKDNVLDAISRGRWGMTKAGADRISKFLKGRPAPNKGVSPSLKTRRKISIAVTGKRRTPEQCAILSLRAFERERRFKRQGYAHPHSPIDGRFV